MLMRSCFVAPFQISDQVTELNKICTVLGVNVVPFEAHQTWYYFFISYNL